MAVRRPLIFQRLPLMSCARPPDLSTSGCGITLAVPALRHFHWPSPITRSKNVSARSRKRRKKTRRMPASAKRAMPPSRPPDRAKRRATTAIRRPQRADAAYRCRCPRRLDRIDESVRITRQKNRRNRFTDSALNICRHFRPAFLSDADDPTRTIRIVYRLLPGPISSPAAACRLRPRRAGRTAPRLPWCPATRRSYWCARRRT